MEKKLNNNNLNNLEKIIGYKFNDQKLLKEAITHSSKSCFNSKHSFNYERLEFLGDRILGFIISEEVFRNYLFFSEGQLNTIFQKYTNEKFLSIAAKNLNLDRYIICQRGDNLDKNVSILADVMESIIAAIYIDSSISECRSFIFGKIIKSKQLIFNKKKHPKSDLQEISLKYFKLIPSYKLIKKNGPDHLPEFCVSVKINNKLYAESEGKNIQMAEHNAAKKLIPLVKKFVDDEQNNL